MIDQEKPKTIDVFPLLGENTASAPTGLALGQWRYVRNGMQGLLGGIRKRFGSIPVTTTPLNAPIERLSVYQANSKILATKGTELHKYAAGAFTLLTGTLTSGDVYDIDFTNASSVSRKIIADKGSLKAYDDATESVAAITPATDDGSPAPPNNLATLNTKGIRYVWSYTGHVFIAFEKSDEIWYSKRYQFDYVPSVQFQRFVKNNDYVNGCGVAFDNVSLIPMRKSWGVLQGTTFDDFTGNEFLNTVNGVIAPRSIAKITYPDGTQTIAFLSDDEAHEVYDTGLEGNGARRYSTRSIMKDKVDFKALGLTEDEKKAAFGYFDSNSSLYILRFNKGVSRLAYAYDTRNREWYPWTNIKANSIVRTDQLHFAGETGHLHKFDDTIHSDWDDTAKTTGTPIDYYPISDMLFFEESGFSSYLDYLLVWAKQYSEKSSIDVSVVFFHSTQEMNEAIKNQYMVWDETAWGDAVWANLDFTDLVGKPARLIFKKKSFYFQVRFRNNRDEPVELYRYRLVGRTSGE
jgi:hypothetical protein